MNRQDLKDFFHFNKGDRRGILFLAIILILVILLRFFLPRPTDREPAHLDAFIEMLDNDTEGHDSAGVFPGKGSPDENGKIELHPFSFNPNTVDRDALLSMGLPSGLVNTFMNYRSKGGRFYRAGDIRKIYGMNDSIYNILSPYVHIEIASSGVRADHARPLSVEPALLMIELNTADTSDLMELWGIGPVFSNRIVRYRDLLGGFYSLEQLMEVYGLSTDLFDTIRHHLLIDTNEISKMDLNRVTVEHLSRHPYVDSYQARAIIDYRTFKDRITSVHELASESLLSKDDFIRIRPYLKVGPELP